jgi:hypothetical protein
MITYTVGILVGICSGDSLSIPLPPLPVGGCGPVCEGYIDTSQYKIPGMCRYALYNVYIYIYLKHKKVQI